MLAEMRRVNYARRDPPVYKPLRRISVPLSFVCVRLGISPFLLSFASLGAACVAAWLLAQGDDGWRWAALWIVLSYVFDCMDGEVARGRGVTSALGSHVENVSNWLVICVLQFGVTIGAQRASPSTEIWIYGFVATLGWLSFYYLYLQLRMWAFGSGHFAALRLWSRILFLMMPLDENLLLLACIGVTLPAFVMICGFLAPALFAVTLLLFFIGAIAKRRSPETPDGRD